MHKKLFEQAQDNFTIGDEKMGKVTFKNASQQDESQGSRVGTNHSQKRKKEDDDPNNSSNRMLKTEEIREICDKHQLTRMEVYNIRSQFAGMCLMSKEDEQKELQELRAAQDGAKNDKNKSSNG